MPKLQLRPAMLEDAKMVFAWRNDPFILARGSSQRAVEWDEHLKWFEETVHDGSRKMFIVLLDDNPVGQVRFDRTDEHTCEVSIYLLPAYTGRGIGVVALKTACWEAFAHLGVKRIVALIRKDNQQSVSAFRKAGFAPVSQNGLNVPTGHFALLAERPASVPHNRLTHGAPEAQAIAHTVQSGHWAAGPKVVELEMTLARIADVRYAVCVASGLAALRLALRGFGIQPGDNVLVPAYSCVALANATLACGASPVPIDVTPDDWNFSARDGERQLAMVAPRAIIVVNTLGVPAPIDQIMDWDIPIIEDCAHAFGITLNGKPLGGRTHAAILSFYATKLIGAGEGGAILTNSEELAQFVRSWRDYSDQPPDGTRLNDKMTDLEATLALCQLDRLQDMIVARQELAKRYHDLLAREATCTNMFRLPDISRSRIWYRYAVEMRNAPARAVVDHLDRYGIHAAEPVTDWRPSGSPECPEASSAYRHVVSLPLYPTLTPEEQDRVVHAFLAFCREHTYT